ncbi:MULTISPECIES: hypothetical protein [unclassified Pseudonocardia]|uniref:hypothetical protein n=1 Tax=unclassified Pseudonocardia TaxID=2619320 RepID=UPI000A6299F4|nr:MULTISPECIES: hypothetical protein [unclassified Pseudonocardia]
MNANESTGPIVDRQVIQPDLTNGRHRLRDQLPEHSPARASGYTAWLILLVLGCTLVVAMLLITVLWN